MLGIDHLPLFIVSGLLLNITPGQDTFYILGQTVAHGRRAGCFAVLGIITGCMIHTLAAAFGLSAILATSAATYQAVKLIGAAYLVYLGLRMLASPQRPLGAGAEIGAPQTSMSSVFRGGLLSNVLNPKTALFFLAFLPQFVSPAADHRVAAFLFLGTLFIVNGIPWCLFLVWTASTMRQRMNSDRGTVVLVERATGALFIGLGVRLGLSR